MMKFKEVRHKEIFSVFFWYITLKVRRNIRITGILLTGLFLKNVIFKSKRVYRKDVCQFQVQKIDFCQNVNVHYDENQRHD